MKTFKYLAYFLVATLPLFSCGGGDDADGEADDGQGKPVANNANKNVTVAQPELGRLEFPHVKGNGHSVVIVHKTNDRYDAAGVNFATEWDYQLGSQRWSCWQMHTGYGGSYTRYDYKEDPYNKDGRQYPWDADLSSDLYSKVDYYTNSGFDHGHICPAADRSYSFLADKQTFYMTNMQPQFNIFNAGIWLDLENQIRNWTPKNGTDTLYVCKGGTIDNEDQIIKRISGKQIVPKYFFTALLMKNSLGYKAIGFWFEHKALNEKGTALSKYAVSIADLEKKTGIDFFCNLPDDVERKTESSMALKAWGL